MDLESLVDQADGVHRPRPEPAGRIIRILIATTAARSLGRGAFITVMALYLTRSLGYSVSQAGFVITLGSLSGIVGSAAFGRLADRIAPRPILTGLMLLEGVVFAAFTMAASYGGILTLALLLGAANLGGSSVRSVVLARVFTGSERVMIRAKTYMANNVGVGAGAAVGAVALVNDEPSAYRTVFGAVAGVYLVAAVLSLRLPSAAGVVGTPCSPDGVIGSTRLTKDGRYLALTGLSAVLGTHLALIEVAMPLWVTGHTSVPRYLVTVLLILNTLLVIVLQLPAARRSDRPSRAGRSAFWAAVAIAVGNVLMWAAHFGGALAATPVLVAAVSAWTLGEVAGQAATWSLSYELTPVQEAGAYQGFFTMGTSVGVMGGPMIVTSLPLAHGLLGWVSFSALLVAAGIGLRVLAGRVRDVDC